MLRPLWFLLPFSVVGCSSAREEVVAPAEVAVVASSPVVVEKPAVSASAAAAPNPSPEPEPTKGGTQSVDTRIELKPGELCTLRFEANQTVPNDHTVVVLGVVGIRTVAGGSCDSGTLWDDAAEVKAHEAVVAAWKNKNEPPPEQIGPEGGPLVKVGHEDKAAPEDRGETIKFVDIDFDGYRDLLVSYSSGNYGTSFLAWRFDPSKKTFVRVREIEELINPTFDATTKTVSAGSRVGPSVYGGSDYRYENGKLVEVRRTRIYLGHTPSDQPLPDGYDYIERMERRNGKLVVVKKGPEKDLK